MCCGACGVDHGPELTQLRADLACVTEERDEARAQLARAMRVVEAACELRAEMRKMSPGENRAKWKVFDAVRDFEEGK